MDCCGGRGVQVASSWSPSWWLRRAHGPVRPRTDYNAAAEEAVAVDVGREGDWKKERALVIGSYTHMSDRRSDLRRRLISRRCSRRTSLPRDVTTAYCSRRPRALRDMKGARWFSAKDAADGCVDAAGCGRGRRSG
ncbi:hypothetical protein PR202_gb10350 [Eleusine coracana subsp. coracana]|uniref:Uncharacterized protein n=1 Tax=Eleusine coracana subsp. coracana TaxID=191504 RepID=A0AAV5EHD4_ELECO|nr:hypothetical protein PR202_gb10350 [Eleusine coracana subsp. coracana]